MKRSTAALAAMALALLAGGAWAKGGGAPIIVFVPGGAPAQPGDACVAEGVTSGQEAKTSTGTLVLVSGVHGINTSRCPNAAFPILASTRKVAAEAVRNAPSVQCVPQGTRVGDEVTIEFYGIAKVLDVLPATSQCRTGTPANVISAAAHRASKAASGAGGGATPQPGAPRDPTDDDIQKEYDRLYAAAAPAREYRVRHILVRTKDDAQAALVEIRSGKSFADVAAAVSVDPGSRTKGGELGWSTPALFIEEFSKAMVSLDPAGLAPEPTRTRFGWHVIEVTETKVGKDWFPPLAAVKERIAARLKAGNQEAVTRVPVKAVCRKMVSPEVPAAAVREGTKGTVVAEIRVENGKVAQVLSLSGPSVFHPAVTDALNKYECDRLDRPVVATQAFEF